jgi:hypothetical protein
MSDVRSAAYDRIDRFLRDNLDDRDYAPYAEALDVLWEPPPAHAAVIEAAKAIRDVPFTYQFGSEHWIQAFDKLDIAVTALRALEWDA